MYEYLTYCSETWTINVADEARLEAAKIWFLRQILRISCMDSSRVKPQCSFEQVLGEFIDDNQDKTSRAFGSCYQKVTA